MNYCPLISYQREGWTKIDCLGKDCGFADAAGECLIKQALQCYVSKERTAAAEKEERVAKTTAAIVTIIENDSPSSGYPYTMEPSSNCIITSKKSSHDEYWNGL